MVGVHVASFLESHDPRYLELLNEDGQQVSEAVKHCSERLAARDARLLERLAETLRAATVELLQNESGQHEAWGSFLSHGTEVQRILKEKVEPSIRPHQPNAAARLQAVLAAQRDAMTLQASAGLYLKTRGDPALDAFRRAHASIARDIDDYVRLTQSRRSAVWGEQLQQSLEQWTRLGQRLIDGEKDRDRLLRGYQTSQKDFTDGLLRAASLIERASPLSWKRRLWSALPSAGANVLLCGACAGLALFVRRRLLRPLALMTQRVDAAAAGDLSREIQIQEWDEIGQLGAAVNRLLSVLNRSENLVYHLAALVESSGEAIISYALDGTILSWNKGAQRIYGYAAEEIKGASITLLMPMESGAVMKALLERVKNGEKVNPLEMTHVGKNDRPVQAFLRVAAIFDSTKRVIGASMCVQELSALPSQSRPLTRSSIP
jgi:PAS domain S-box-containing protein